MTKKAAFFDIDGTLLPHTSMDRIFYLYLLKKGVLGIEGLWNTFTFAVKNLSKGKECIVKKNKAYLKGKSVSELQKHALRCFQEEIFPIIPEKVRKLLLDHREKGDKIIFLSAALQSLVDAWTFELEGDCGIGTHIEVIDDLYTGNIIGIHPYGEGKVSYIEQLAEEWKLDLHTSFGYGEHYSDRFFLEKVGHPVALHPDKKLFAFAKEHGWAIITKL